MLRVILKYLKGLIYKNTSKCIDDSIFDDVGYVPQEFKLTVVERPTNRNRLTIVRKKDK